MSRTIRTLLVANRGDVALRVFRTCRSLGIRTVAVFSDADDGAAFVDAADVALRIGPASAAASYLSIPALLEAARTAGADAIHPGWGFLSERADFASAVRDAGLVWVGPPPAALLAFGDKAAARQAAEALGVPVLAGTGRVTDDEALHVAQRLGLPLLVKAVAGGGGRGQRRVDDFAGLPEALAAARREALAAFGDDGVLLERFAFRPRHVEVQILADTQGRVVALGDRDCSIQRRNQKVFEEAPAPGLDDATRAALHRDAVRLCAAAGYTGAGTVEFLVEPDGRHFFLEVNARLQVEHAVTEAVAGIDLVAMQIAVAEGRPLPEICTTPNGHAVEARLVAEDPLAGWRPTTGRLVRVDLPARDGLRIESTVRAGDTVSPHYDGLLARVVAWGPDRDAALRRLRTALAEAWVPGLTTNLPVLRDVASCPAFAAADLHTGFLDANGLPGSLPDHASEAAVVAVLVAATRRGSGVEAVPPAFRLTGPVAQTDRFAPDRSIRWTHGPEGITVDAGEGPLRASATPLGGDRHLLRRGDERRIVRVAEVGGDDEGAVYVHFGDCEGMAVRLPRFPLPAPPQGAAGTCVAPGPATVGRVFVAVGDAVVAGQRLLALEAMKVETLLTSPEDGVVVDLHVAPGDVVEAGAVLVRLAAAPESG
jgi:propionyl-CoA carboxylase alpha chain